MKRNQQSLEFLCFKQEQELYGTLEPPFGKSESHTDRFVFTLAENTADKIEVQE